MSRNAKSIYAKSMRGHSILPWTCAGNFLLKKSRICRKYSPQLLFFKQTCLIAEKINFEYLLMLYRIPKGMLNCYRLKGMPMTGYKDLMPLKTIFYYLHPIT